MNEENVRSYRKVDEFLMKMAVILFIILILTQWYLRNFSKGIEPFLNKLYNDKGLSFKVIEIVSGEVIDNDEE